MLAITNLESTSNTFIRVAYNRASPHLSSPPIPLLTWRFLLFSVLTLAFCALPLGPKAFAVTPDPDGGYLNANTAEGNYALFSLTNGFSNTGIGRSALYSVTTGKDNTAVGDQALFSNTNNSNTAVGTRTLYFNNSGAFNTALGSEALHSNNDGGVNVAIGYKALEANQSGFYNVATGGFALGTNAAGSYNVATGANALYYNNGSQNTASGHQALQNNNTGANNVALGFQAGANLTTGSNNIVIGANVPGAAGDANKIRIGRQGTQTSTFIAGIYNVNEGGTIKPVYVNSSGRLGTQPPASSARFKEQITPMNKTSEAILRLRPVTFRYKGDDDRTPQFGLIAEEVARVNPDLVLRDEDGKVYTVRYEAVSAMLLNEFLKEHAQVQELKAAGAKQTAIAQEQAATITQLKKQIEVLTATVQKVSEEVALGKPAPQLVTNP